MNALKFHTVCVDCKKNKQDVCFLFMAYGTCKTNDFCEDCYKNRLQKENIKAEKERKEADKKNIEKEKEIKKAEKEAKKKGIETEKEIKRANKEVDKNAKKKRDEDEKAKKKADKEAKKKHDEAEKERKEADKKFKKDKKEGLQPNIIKEEDGCIYALYNESYPNMFKIGCTGNDTEIRAKQLYTTGVPTPFKVVDFRHVHNYKKKEKDVHNLLEHMGHRVNSKREFFNVSLETIKLIFELIDNNA